MRVAMNPGTLILRQWWWPEVLTLLLGLTAIYLLAIGPVRRRYFPHQRVASRQVAYFLSGVGAIYLAEGTPLHALAESYLFSAHMVQHVLLTTCAPLLFLLGTPAWLWRQLLRPRCVRAAARVLTHPVVAALAFNVIYAIWHLPELYDAALFNHDIHILQHMVLIPTAMMMWWPLLSPLPELPRLTPPAQMLYLFVLSLSQLAIFGPVTFSREVLYATYAAAPRLWGISPLLDQQLSGVIMKLSGAGVFLLLLGYVFFQWAAREGAAATCYNRDRGPYYAAGKNAGSDAS